jgi:tRNA threonylcarbamoyladenosine biosynthesis protein TsaE
MLHQAAAPSLYLAGPADTTRLGAWLAANLHAGDTVLLRGAVGAGKSHVARSVIQSRLGRLEEVPSPTFTLVQTYGEGADEIWHADLYRLGHADEVAELGLDDAFGRAICLVEWPERLGRSTPPSALHIGLAPAGAGRQATLRGSPDWATRLARLPTFADV